MYVFTAAIMCQWYDSGHLFRWRKTHLMIVTVPRGTEGERPLAEMFSIGSLQWRICRRGPVKNVAAVLG